MIEEQLGRFLAEEGYTMIPSNLPEFTIYFRMENNYVNVFHVISYQKNLYISEDQYSHIKDKIKDLFKEKGINNIHILSLILSQDMQKAKQLCAGDVQCWIIDPCDRRLIIYENQINDFYGMKGKLEYFLSHMDTLPKVEAATDLSFGNFIKVKKQIPYMTAFFVLINVLVFIICTFTGDLLYNIGAFSASHIMQEKEYYRLFTSMFLHWDINHLVSNMIVLYYLGEVVEKKFGPWRYGIIYLVAGICGNLLSVSYELYAELHILSVGASGAVFGIIGALLILVIVHKGHLDQITFGRLLFMAAYSLYSGFASSEINNAAHVGGFLSGMVIALVLWIIHRVKVVFINRNEERYEN